MSWAIAQRSRLAPIRIRSHGNGYVGLKKRLPAGTSHPHIPPRPLTRVAARLGTRRVCASGNFACWCGGGSISKFGRNFLTPPFFGPLCESRQSFFPRTHPLHTHSSPTFNHSIQFLATQIPQKWASLISSPTPALPVSSFSRQFRARIPADCPEVLNNWLLTRSYVTGYVLYLFSPFQISTMMITMVRVS